MTENDSNIQSLGISLAPLCPYAAHQSHQGIKAISITRPNILIDFHNHASMIINMYFVNIEILKLKSLSEIKQALGEGK